MLGSLLGGNYHDGTFGSSVNGLQAASQAQLGSTWYQNQSGLQNAYNSQLAQSQLRQQYYQQQQDKKPEWVFNGKTCTIRQMADEIWATDCPEKTHFILKYE